mmetsp:Transcript_24178/g.33900  ORF Transcript_24178/g.33900 Transcript_24178/m.33900 type:complete len:272 (-) Transcript_24178:184-999(-)
MVSAENTLYKLLRGSRKRNSGISGVEMEAGIDFLRSQDEEAYKVMVAPVLAVFFNELVGLNEKNYVRHAEPIAAAFEAPVAPDITISDYLDRIVKYTPCSAECYLIALVFIDRIIESKSIRVTRHNVHRLLITSIMIASKLMDDGTYNNKYYSHVGGISVKELNHLECEFLMLMDYNLNVDHDTFECYRYDTEIQVLRYCTDELPSADEPAVFNAAEDSLLRARANSQLLCKKLRRTQSFNQVPGAARLQRKRRSASFDINVLELAESLTE